MRLGTAPEVVALDRPLKALPLAPAGHLHARAHLEGLDGHRVAELELRLFAELDQPAKRLGVHLLQVPELGFGEALSLRLAERELDRVIAVPLGRANGRHRAWPGRQNGHALDAAVLLEDLRHAEL